MDARLLGDVSITDLFDQFIEASTMRNVLSIHHRILNYADLSPCEFNIFFPKLKRAILSSKERKNWKAKALFSKIDKKAAHRCYSNTKTSTPLGNRISDTRTSQEHLDDSTSQPNRNHTNNALQHYNCLVIGSGPAGLRTAIELQLLGASQVVVVEKRNRFSRNNVLHLWPFVIDDLKSLGAKKFYGKFCAGSIDHISIRQLQLMLLKICLMIGCDFRDSCSYLYLCPESLRQSKSESNFDGDIKRNTNSSDSKNESTFQKCDFKDQTISDAYVKCKLDLVPDVAVNASQDSGCQRVTDVACQDITVDAEQDICSNDVKSISKLLSVGHSRKGENLKGARAHFQSDHNFQEKELHSLEWDIIVGADGRRNTLSKYFPRKEFRGRLAIAITANFINRQTPIEASIPEISGLSFIYNQDMFNALSYDTNIQLENICYYKDDTHYFVMTAKKKSLIERGVLIKDYATTQDLLSDKNVNKDALLKYAKDAASWTTGLEPLDFALNHYGQEDCAMFDFTSMYAASNACKALRTKEGGLTLVNLVGDSLLEPFWPTGSGCARGFLSSFDSAWMCRQWAVNRCAVIDHHGSVSSRHSRNRTHYGSDSLKIPCDESTYNRMALSVIAERESIYRILAQTKSENLQQNYSHWTLNPHTRYPNLNRHLVTPNQCEHLLTDYDASLEATKLPISNTSRVKSPNNSNQAKSPKKLKAANLSPSSQRKNRSRSKSSKQAHKSKIKHANTVDDIDLEFERSYNNLVDSERDNKQYLSYHQASHEAYDELFIPSISGTMPSSNNLLNLEARRARDIDDCLRQRRLKSQIGTVKDHLMLQLRQKSLVLSDDDSSKGPAIRGNAALFSAELRRLRDQQALGKENFKGEITGPLTLLNSMRRCASFAERVKSFESKLSSSGQESTPTTPRTPSDAVKNLAEFAALQELFDKTSKDTDIPKKSKIPIMKLSKDDWNVKCWEKRLASYRQRMSKEFSSSTRSLNKSISVDSYQNTTSSKSERQIEAFKGRIKEMAEKLEKSKDSNNINRLNIDNIKRTINRQPQKNVRPSNWVNHLKQELTKGTQQAAKKPMNPSIPNKPIKKLFADEDDNDDGIDVNKHYDHLCVNKASRLFSKNGYTSHLRRTKYDCKNFKVINANSAVDGKQNHLAITTRTSSASSTLSDYSTNTGGSSGCGAADPADHQPDPIAACSRCKKHVASINKIGFDDAILHRSCLNCSNCGITLRTNEIQYHLDSDESNSDKNKSQVPDGFVCAICNPAMRAIINQASFGKAIHVEETVLEKEDLAQQRMKSRADFLSEKINYTELYKNIFEEEGGHHERKVNQTITGSPELLGAKNDNNFRETIRSPSPISVTLPLQIVLDKEKNDDPVDKSLISGGYRIARSETIDGSEQVTLVLPGEENSTDTSYECRDIGQEDMVDEDELNRILQIEKSEQKSPETHNADDETSDETESNIDDDEVQGGDVELSDDPSSLNSPPDTEDYDDEDDEDEEPTNIDQNSTYDDFLTSEEFGFNSDREDAESNSNTAEVDQQESSGAVQVHSG